MVILAVPNDDALTRDLMVVDTTTAWMTATVSAAVWVAVLGVVEEELSKTAVVMNRAEHDEAAEDVDDLPIMMEHVIRVVKKGTWHATVRHSKGGFDGVEAVVAVAVAVAVGDHFGGVVVAEISDRSCQQRIWTLI